MKQAILLLGAGGFWGRSVSEYLRNERSDHYEVIAIGSPLDGFPSAETVSFDHSFEDVRRLIDRHNPMSIINLIGTFSGAAHECYEKNTFFSLALMEAVRDTDIQLLLIGTAAEYGMVSSLDLPLTEDHPLNPVSDYGISKAAQSFHIRQYANQYGIDVRLLRVFNLIGSGLSPRLAPGGFAERIAKLKREGGRELIVGNLNPKRDYIGVSTATQMLMSVMERGSAGGVYHICSGYSIPMKELVQTMLKKSGLEDVALTVDPALLKRFDVPDIYGSREKVSTLLPELHEQVIRDSFDRDLDELLKGAGLSIGTS